MRPVQNISIGYNDLVYLSSEAKRLIDGIKSKFTSSITLLSHSTSYSPTVLYIRRHISLRNLRHFTFSGEFVTNFDTIITFREKKIRVQSVVVEDNVELTLSCFGSSSLLLEFVDEAKRDREARNKLVRHVTYKYFAERAESYFVETPAKPDNTLILPDLDILDDVDEFLKSEKKYYRLGIPWRRGYLLHGPPGTGKSSLVHTIAKRIERGVYLITTNNLDVIGQALTEAAFYPGIMLFEDLDFSENADEIDPFLLSVLDGKFTVPGTIFIITCLDKNNLHPTLIRPGRVDYTLEFHNINLDGAKTMYLRFFPDDLVGAEEFADEWVGKPPAELQMELMKRLRKHD